MTFENVPWAVDGGRTPAAAARMAVHDSAEGVLGPLDLRVEPTAPTSGAVVIRGGGAKIVNRYANQGNESYIARNVGDEVVAVSPTAGASRVDLLVARIDDPEFGGQVPADPLVGPYFKPQIISGVPSGTTSARALNLGYPAIALARLDIPASTSSITAAMITDVRRVANPKKDRQLRSFALTSGNTDTLDATVSVEEWPNNPGWTVEIPEWATVANIVATWGSVFVPPGSAWGKLLVRIGSTASGNYFSTQEVSFDTPGAAGNTRMTTVLGDDIPIPVAYRGTTQVVNLMGKIDGGASAAYPKLDYGSSIVLDIEFLERAASA